MIDVMKNKWWIIIIIILALITPVILNIIIGSTNPLDSIKVVGTEVDWLVFYGSYIGGVLSAAIAFITMWQSSKHNTLNIMIPQQEAYIKELNSALSERISKLDFAYIGSISLHTTEEESEEFYKMIPKVLDELNELSKDTSRLFNSYGLLHSQTQNADEKDLNEFYETCVKQYKKRVDEMTLMLAIVQNGRKTAQHSEIYKLFRSDLADFNLKLKTDKEKYTDVFFKKANSIIQAEEKKLEKLNREKKKIFPTIPK